MGYNTTVVILNDSLDDIANDVNFGKKLANAVRNVINDSPIRISSGTSGTAAVVIETHHADYNVYVEVGGNMGRIVPSHMFGNKKD